MVCFENAKLIDAEELKETVEEEFSNPTVQRLMFIETKEKGDIPGKVFPCYPEGWVSDAMPPEDVMPTLRFKMCIVQSSGGSFGMVEVVIPAKELGVTKRIWDKPPTRALRNDTPWLSVPPVETEVQ